MSSKNDETPYNNEIFWSFYELSNGEIIVLQFIDNLTNGVVTSSDFEFAYSNLKLKTVGFKKYQFGIAKPNTYEMSKEFFDWFNSIPAVKNHSEIKFPSSNEEDCVKSFYLEHIESKKDIETETIECHKVLDT